MINTENCPSFEECKVINIVAQWTQITDKLDEYALREEAGDQLNHIDKVQFIPGLRKMQLQLESDFMEQKCGICRAELG